MAARGKIAGSGNITEASMDGTMWPERTSARFGGGSGAWFFALLVVLIALVIEIDATTLADICGVDGAMVCGP